MFGKVRARFGAVSTSNTNYTLSCIKNWGPVAALGMDPEDFENLPDNGDLSSIMGELAKFEADMDGAQVSIDYIYDLQNLISHICFMLT